MPRTPASANAIALPDIIPSMPADCITSRRDVLTAGCAGAAIAALVVPVVILPKAEAAPVDPLIDLIKAYRTGLVAFDADPSVRLHDDERTGQRAMETWEGPFLTLEENAPPARTRSAAIEALRLAQDELLREGAIGIVSPLVAAALAYFEGEKRA
ncbi:hypothetical protein V5F59_10145 [Xanthobacter autotrophicus DSM 431]|uniref:hypothetical protein n=1 Tax=Xanthobacter nonsaccharivorans TaxID=3119912 RepID=UPI0037273D51